MKKSLIYSLLVAAAAIALPSCSNDNDTPQTTNNILITVSKDVTFTASCDMDVNRIQWDSFDGAIYNLAFDFNAATCAIGINNLRYTLEQEAISFIIPAMPLDKQTDANIRSLHYPGSFNVIGSDNKSHTVSNISLYLLIDPDRVVTFEGKKSQENSLFIAFTIDNRYSVHAIPTYNYYFGETSTTGGAYPDFSTDKTIYRLSVDPSTRTANIDLLNPIFTSAMPAFSRMQFKALPYTLTGSGIKLTMGTFTPSVWAGDQMLNATGFTILNLDTTVEFPLPTFDADSHFLSTFSVEGLIKGQTVDLGDVTVKANLPL